MLDVKWDTVIFINYWSNLGFCQGLNLLFQPQKPAVPAASCGCCVQGAGTEGVATILILCRCPLPSKRERGRITETCRFDFALSFCPIGTFPFSGTCSENLFCMKDSFCEPDIVLWAFYPVSNKREKVLFHINMYSAYNSATILWAFNKYSSRIWIQTPNRK